jgi:hypothetical protein
MKNLSEDRDEIKMNVTETGCGSEMAGTGFGYELITHSSENYEGNSHSTQGLLAGYYQFLMKDCTILDFLIFQQA